MQIEKYTVYEFLFLPEEKKAEVHVTLPHTCPNLCRQRQAAAILRASAVAAMIQVKFGGKQSVAKRRPLVGGALGAALGLPVTDPLSV